VHVSPIPFLFIPDLSPVRAGEFDNAGAMMSVDETLMCSFQGTESHPCRVLLFVAFNCCLPEKIDFHDSIAACGKEKGFCRARQHSSFSWKALKADPVEVRLPSHECFSCFEYDAFSLWRPKI
jgi:hypothetical protein